MRIEFLCCFLSLIVFSGFDAGAVPKDGMILHFSFDEIDGDTVINETGVDINGKLEGDAEQVAGYLGMGIALNPDAGEAEPGQDFVRVDPEINVDEQFTIAAWVYANSFGAYRSIASCTDNTGYAFAIQGSVPTSWVCINGAYTQITGNIQMQTDRWYHMALTYDGNDIALYVDGEENARRTSKGSITLSTSDFMIGGEPVGADLDPSWPAWHGIIDEFYLYNRALKKEEISSLIDASSPVEPVTKLTACWGRVKRSK